MLKHLHHKTFHKEAVSSEDDHENTRFCQRPISTTLYNRERHEVTSFRAVKIPRAEFQILRYEDGAGDKLFVSPGSTAFVSSFKMFNSLCKKN